MRKSQWPRGWFRRAARVRKQHVWRLRSHLHSGGLEAGRLGHWAQSVRSSLSAQGESSRPLPHCAWPYAPVRGWDLEWYGKLLRKFKWLDVVHMSIRFWPTTVWGRDLKKTEDEGGGSNKRLLQYPGKKWFPAKPQWWLWRWKEWLRKLPEVESIVLTNRSEVGNEGKRGNQEWFPGFLLE